MVGISTTPRVQDNRFKVAMSIASTTSISNVLDTQGYRVAAIEWPAGASAPLPITFQVSNDGSSFFNLYDDAGSEVAISSNSFSTAVARSIALGPTMALQLGGSRYVKFRLGTAASPTSINATGIAFDAILTPW